MVFSATPLVTDDKSYRGFSFRRVFIEKKPIAPAGFADLGGSMALDSFRFQLVETHQFRSGLLVDTQQLVQLGVQRQGIPPVGSLDKQGHGPHHQRRDGVPVECRPIEGQP